MRPPLSITKKRPQDLYPEDALASDTPKLARRKNWTLAFANSSLTLTRNLRVPFDGVADLVFNRNFIQVLTIPTPLEISVFLFFGWRKFPYSLPIRRRQFRMPSVISSFVILGYFRNSQCPFACSISFNYRPDNVWQYKFPIYWTNWRGWLWSRILGFKTLVFLWAE